MLKQALEAFGSTRDGEEQVNVLYLYMLDACEKVFESELDQATFEEHMRWFFRTKVSNSRVRFTLAALLVYDDGYGVLTRCASD